MIVFLCIVNKMLIKVHINTKKEDHASSDRCNNKIANTQPQIKDPHSQTQHKTPQNASPPLIGSVSEEHFVL